jgi:hypothetical protein
MDVAAIDTIITHMKSRSFFDILKAMFHNNFFELRATRWSVQVDGVDLGRVVMSHDLQLDEVLGHASESWAWTENGKARILHLVGERDGRLEATLDGNDLENIKLEMELGDEGVEDRAYLILHLKFAEHDYRFAGLME